MLINITIDQILFVIATFLASFILSLILVATYYITSNKLSNNDNINYLQSLVLMPSVAAMIMQSIGNSIALGFGIFGALAIIRFRTNIADLKDIAFIFCAMAIGIACGVNSFIVATAGTFLFCIIAFIIHNKFVNVFLNIPIESVKQDDIIRIKVIGLDTAEKKQIVDDIFKNYCLNYQLLRFRYLKQKNELSQIFETVEHEYKFTISDFEMIDTIKSKINDMGDVSVDRIMYENKLNLLSSNDPENKV
jgi:uncharacterized membrane protein YhiD involved in acid resistance